MEIEVGEYIRTIDGYIRKIDNINTEKQKITYYGKYVLDIPYKNSQAVAEKKIKTHSKSLIDLIEVGDYVNGKKVLRINDYEDFKRADFNLDYDDGDAAYNEDIKTILTKEQYEQNSYKI